MVRNSRRNRCGSSVIGVIFICLPDDEGETGRHWRVGGEFALGVKGHFENTPVAAGASAGRDLDAAGAARRVRVVSLDLCRVSAGDGAEANRLRGLSVVVKKGDLRKAVGGVGRTFDRHRRAQDARPWPSRRRNPRPVAHLRRAVGKRFAEVGEAPSVGDPAAGPAAGRNLDRRPARNCGEEGQAKDCYGAFHQACRFLPHKRFDAARKSRGARCRMSSHGPLRPDNIPQTGRGKIHCHIPLAVRCPLECRGIREDELTKRSAL